MDLRGGIGSKTGLLYYKYSTFAYHCPSLNQPTAAPVQVLKDGLQQTKMVLKRISKRNGRVNLNQAI